MIIYDSTVKDFIKNCKDPDILTSLIKKNLYEKFGIKVVENEERSWMNSLPQVAKVLIKSKNDNRRVLVEFNIPTCKKRVDFIILGKNKNHKPSAWIIELKQWSKITEKEWNNFSIGRYDDSHPSDQANNYKEMIDEQMGLKNLVDIKASAYLHNMNDKDNALFKGEYKEILNKAKLYTILDKNELKNSIEKHTIIKNASKTFEFFKDMKWMPTKSFRNIVKEDFKSISLSPSQKLIYDKIEHFIRSKNYYDFSTKKHIGKVTFIISGDPGSGKTIVAFKLLNLLVSKFGMNIQMMLPGQEIRATFKDEMYSKVLSSKISGSNVKKGYEAAIIDEAHKAVARDTGIINYERNYKKLKFVIILIDNDQVINKKGITKEEVVEIAEKNDHKVFTYNIEENFRNFGERVLLDWIDHTFYKRKIILGDISYKQEKYINKNYKYKLYGYNNAKKFTDAYFKIRKQNQKTRLTSLWTESFYIGPSDKNGNPLPSIFIGNEGFIWNPNGEWKNKLIKNNPKDYNTYNSHVKKLANDIKLFLIGNPNERFVAYFNHIQGFEFDNIFVYISNVFTYKDGEMIFHRDKLTKDAKNSQSWAPNSNSKGLKGRDSYKLNKQYFLNRLKVMLTRGTRSTHVFAEDKKLNEYINNKIY